MLPVKGSILFFVLKICWFSAFPAAVLLFPSILWFYSCEGFLIGASERGRESYLWSGGVFRGRPQGRSVGSSPGFSAVPSCHEAVSVVPQTRTLTCPPLRPCWPALACDIDPPVYFARATRRSGHRAGRLPRICVDKPAEYAPSPSASKLPHSRPPSTTPD